MNDVVVDRDVVSPIGLVGLNRHFSDPHTAGSQIVQVRLDDAAVLATAAEPDAVDADVTDFAAFDGHVPRAIGHDHGRDAGRRLPVAVSGGGQQVLAMLEREPLQRHVFDPAGRSAARPRTRRTGPAPAPRRWPCSCPRRAAADTATCRPDRGTTRPAHRAPGENSRCGSAGSVPIG